jgi:glucose-1-phosphate adenylyltransferase
LLNHNYIIPVPAQMRTAGETWYQGTSDAIYQNINLIEQSNPDIVLVFGADHIYRMNIQDMISYHRTSNASATVAALPVEKRYASDFGVIEVDDDNRVIGFHEKKADAPTMPDDPEQVYASMGNYVFSTEPLVKALMEDAKDKNSSHDFGRDILPKMVAQDQRLMAYNFNKNKIPGEPEGKAPYWRDVGTIDAYYEATMDLRAVTPALNLYNRRWPLRTAGYSDPPAKFVFDEEGRRGQAIDSIVSGSCILSGGLVRHTVLGRGVRIHSGAVVEHSVIFDNCEVGRGSQLRRTILDKNVKIPENSRIGFDLEEDRKKYTVTDSGIVVVEGHRSSVPLAKLNL